MASFAVKTLFVTALVCLVFDLAASEHQKNVREDTQQLESAGYETAGYETAAGHEDVASTTAAPGSFKDKLKGIVKNVKKGASDVYESVSGSVSGAIDKIKGTFNRDSSAEKHSSAERDHQHAPDANSSEERHHH